MTVQKPEPKPRVRVQHQGGGRAMTKQSDALRSDVSAIMSRWIAHGAKPGIEAQAEYGDFTSVDSYHAALNKLKEAETNFMRLPAHIRKHVGNDPGQFLEMVYDPERRGELDELGLTEKQAPADAPPAAPKEEPETPPA